MDSYFNIIQKPLITERATAMKALSNQYAFRVATGATKHDIKAAIQHLFKVQVLAVNTMRVHGKFRRMGSSRGAYRPDWKKAIVTLKAGQEIRPGEESK